MKEVPGRGSESCQRLLTRQGDRRHRLFSHMAARRAWPGSCSSTLTMATSGGAARKEEVYRPRHPEKRPFYSVLYRHYDKFKAAYDERFQKEHGRWRDVVDKVVGKYFNCGIFLGGYALTDYIQLLRRSGPRHDHSTASSLAWADAGGDMGSEGTRVERTPDCRAARWVLRHRSARVDRLGRGCVSASER